MSNFKAAQRPSDKLARNLRLPSECEIERLETIVIMEQDEKERLDVRTAKSGDVSPESQGILGNLPQGNAAFLEKQTRTRRLFNEKQLFAFSLVYMGTWSGVPA